MGGKHWETVQSFSALGWKGNNWWKFSKKIKELDISCVWFTAIKMIKNLALWSFSTWGWN